MAKGRSNFHLQRYLFIFATILSIAALGVVVYASQNPTNTQSEATGENAGSLSNCTVAKGYAGGIELFDGPNQTLDQRVMCISLNKYTGDSVNYDHNLGTGETKILLYSNIWNFNNKTDSIKLRANPFCRVKAEIFKYTDYRTLLETYIAGANSVDDVHVKKINLPSAKRGMASSLKLTAWCDYSKYRDVN